jgi:hypothetical protein
MTVRLATAILLLLRTPGIAHRLDEYLQATLVEIEKDRLRAEVTLTPGVAVADFVIRTIDTDADGAISAAEEEAYARRVLEDLALTVDGRRVALRIVSTHFPGLSEIREGTGEIQLELASALPHGGRERRVVLVNRHQNRIAAYQMNCRLPRDPRIQIAAQKRNYTQSSYELDYEETDVRQGVSGLIWLTPLALLLTARLIYLWRQWLARYLRGSRVAPSRN